MCIRDRGLIDDDRYAEFLAKKELIQEDLDRLGEITVHPTIAVNEYLAGLGETGLNGGVKADVFLRRPKVTVEDVERLTGQKLAGDRYVKEQVEIDIKYAGYIKKQEIQVARLRRQEAKKIPKDIDYDQIEGLATEAREKFAKIRPETLAQAERISGVNPADLAILSVYVQNGKYAKVQK